MKSLPVTSVLPAMVAFATRTALLSVMTVPLGIVSAPVALSVPITEIGPFPPISKTSPAVAARFVPKLIVRTASAPTVTLAAVTLPVRTASSARVIFSAPAMFVFPPTVTFPVAAAVKVAPPVVAVTALVTAMVSLFKAIDAAVMVANRELVVPSVCVSEPVTVSAPSICRAAARVMSASRPTETGARNVASRSVFSVRSRLTDRMPLMRVSPRVALVVESEASRPTVTCAPVESVSLAMTVRSWPIFSAPFSAADCGAVIVPTRSEPLVVTIPPTMMLPAPETTESSVTSPASELTAPPSEMPGETTPTVLPEIVAVAVMVPAENKETAAPEAVSGPLILSAPPTAVARMVSASLVAIPAAPTVTLRALVSPMETVAEVTSPLNEASRTLTTVSEFVAWKPAVVVRSPVSVSEAKSERLTCPPNVALPVLTTVRLVAVTFAPKFSAAVPSTMIASPAVMSDWTDTVPAEVSVTSSAAFTVLRSVMVAPFTVRSPVLMLPDASTPRTELSATVAAFPALSVPSVVMPAPTPATVVRMRRSLSAVIPPLPTEAVSMLSPTPCPMEIESALTSPLNEIAFARLMSNGRLPRWSSPP